MRTFISFPPFVSKVAADLRAAVIFDFVNLNRLRRSTVARPVLRRPGAGGWSTATWLGLLTWLCLTPLAFAADSTPTKAPDLASNPASVAAKINPALPSLFVAGDSTAAKGAGEKQQGWGVPFADYFDPAKVNVVNRARGGRSSRTFITEGLWDQLLADVKAGDIVLIQFGHNDAGALNDEPPPPLRARGTIKGLGEETKEIDNVLTKKHEVVHTFGWYMRKMVADTKAKGATPIVMSLTIRNVWKDGKLERGSGQYGEWSAEIAQTAGVQFIDLTTLVADQFEPMGEAKVTDIYPQDHTHFNAVGADLHAAQVVAGLKGLKTNPVKNWLSAKGAAGRGGENEIKRMTRPRLKLVIARNSSDEAIHRELVKREARL